MFEAVLTNSTWFERDDLEGQIEKRGVSPPTKELIRNYRRDGYVILEAPVADAATIDEAVAKLDGHYVGTATGYDQASRVQDAWQSVPSVKRIATSSTVMEFLATLYQREPIPFQTLNFLSGTQQKAHNDTIHFNSLPYGFMCGVWVALEDVNPDSGPLFYYKGSHRLPVLHMSDLGLAPGESSYLMYEDAVEKILQSKSYEKELGIIKKGQAIV